MAVINCKTCDTGSVAKYSRPDFPVNTVCPWRWDLVSDLAAPFHHFPLRLGVVATMGDRVWCGRKTRRATSGIPITTAAPAMPHLPSP